MPNSTLSPNMSLTIPTVGQETGPQWASDINADLSLLDSHDHSSGKGVQITPAGININADLTLVGNNLTTARSLRLSPQVSPIAGASDLAALYASGVDLYFNDANGNQIRITQSGGLAGTPGSIANLVAPASATYVSAQSVFVFQSGANQAANLDGGSFTLRNLTISSFGLTLSPPTLASNYTITLPALPASSAPMVIDNSGNISAPPALYGAFCPTGVTLPYAGTASPSGWLACDGSAVSRSTYASLFAVIGVTFGAGNGSTTFNVPDMRGVVPMGVGGGFGAALGATGGEYTHTLNTSEMPSHSHTVNDPGHAHTFQNSSVDGGANIAQDGVPSAGLNSVNSSVTGISLQSTGGGGAHNNVQPFVALNYIIKT